MARDRSISTSLDIRLQLRATKALDDHLAKAHKEMGAVVVMDPVRGDVLAMVSAPRAESIDRARYAGCPPGSTFKLVTAIAALRLDPKLADKRFSCQRLAGGRVGTISPGIRQPIRYGRGDCAHG